MGVNVNNAVSLYNHLKGRKDALVFVTGPTGAGKSTIVSNLAVSLRAVGIHPGKAVRRSKKLIKLVKESENPSAPHVTEQFVRDYIKKRLDKNREKAIIVDGVPRNEEQVRWCVDLALDYDRNLVFVYVSVPLNMRIDRLTGRGQAGDKQLMKKKLHTDEEIMPNLIRRIQDVVVGGKFGVFYEVFNRRDTDFTRGGIDGATRSFV